MPFRMPCTSAYTHGTQRASELHWRLAAGGSGNTCAHAAPCRPSGLQQEGPRGERGTLPGQSVWQAHSVVAQSTRVELALQREGGGRMTSWTPHTRVQPRRRHWCVTAKSAAAAGQKQQRQRQQGRNRSGSRRSRGSLEAALSGLAGNGVGALARQRKVDLAELLGCSRARGVSWERGGVACRGTAPGESQNIDSAATTTQQTPQTAPCAPVLASDWLSALALVLHTM